MLPGDEGSLPSAGTIVTPNASSFTSINQSNRSAKDYPIQTSVFGVTGTGSKFVYIFDRSASMTDLDGLPMRAAKSHLVASLVTLDDVHQFQIIFYNDRLTFFNPRAPLPPGLLFASEGVKRQAVSFVRDIAADGGTNHIDALNRGIALQPDVIFFLTDADDPQLSSADLSEIRRRNKGTIINTVEFGAGAEPKTERTLANLARENGGQYVYVDVLNLKAHP